MPLATYLPQDRRRALAQGQNLPDRAHGSVLFADISGFTPFTEALRHAYGSRRGAEDLSKHLNAVYTTLIAEVERYGGNVTGFAGDAITCWFDNTDEPAPPRAVACAVALQRAMQAFAEIPLPNGETGRLTIKIGLATGEVRRLVVGDRAHYWLDVLAGETVNRTAVAEQLATAPEILLDTATANALGNTITLTEWRTSHETGERFGVLGAFTATETSSSAPPLPTLDEQTTRPWLNPLVYERETTGHVLLQTDFRPCVALFVSFTGIHYEADTAADQLNQFIRPLQAILARYEGTLIDLTFGDKGSYVYINFGTLRTHEDDGRRAVKTAVELQTAAQELGFLAPLQMGITTGVMRTGAYGGPTRRHYGALGDEVNLAARLMQAAVPGEILVSGHIYKTVQRHFLWEARPLITVKGKAKPISIYRLAATQLTHQIHLHEPTYALPMVGRQTELAAIAQKFDLVAEGNAQIVSLVGEAGLGKSRLAAEVLRLTHGRGFASYGGACQSDGLNTPYLVWKQIWVSFFALETAQPPAAQIRHLREQVRHFSPERENALPLLGRLLDLPIPENSFTAGLEPKNRQTALHALLEDCLKRASQESPLLLVIEDLHWIDALSHDLLVELAQALSNFPIFFLIVYRPTELPRLQAPRLQARPNFTPIPLSALNEMEARQIIQAKLNQLYPTQGWNVSPTLVQKLLTRAEGNPFYLEEVLNFLHGRGLDPRHAASWETELPDSLHALILSRLDQLQPSQQRTMRVASVIGRLFPVSWLIGYYPALGELPQVQADLAVLHDLDLTLLDSTEPEIAYLFKHIITHEVTYESLPFATRARLHEQLAHYLEEINAPLNSIAYHYGQSDNRTKQRIYFAQAATVAQTSFANEVAWEYLTRLLPLQETAEAQIAAHWQRAEVLETMGRYEEAEADGRAALALATQIQDNTAVAHTQLRLGRMFRAQGHYTEAHDWLNHAYDNFVHLNDPLKLAQTRIERGNMWWQQGELTLARQELEGGLALAQQGGDNQVAARALKELGSVAAIQGDYSLSQTLYEQSLALYQQIGDKRGRGSVLSNLGVAAYHGAQDYPTAWELNQQALALFREVGDKRGTLIVLVNLGIVAQAQEAYAIAHALYEECITLARELGNKYGLGLSLINLGNLVVEQGDWARAHEAYRESVSLCHEMGDKSNMVFALGGMAAVAVGQGMFMQAARLASAAESLRRAIVIVWEATEGRIYEETLTAVRHNLSPAEFEAAWAEGEAMNLEQAITYALTTPN